jgi:predicted PurR-regulated permease PerM
MAVARPTVFWFAMSGLAVVMLVLLREILLPFAIGMVLAFLLVPAVDRLERLGIARAVAAVTLVLLLLLAAFGLVVVMFPAIIGESKFFLDEFPRYVVRIQSLIADTSRPWLRQVLGEELKFGEATPALATSMGGAWLEDALRSLWSGGRALISILSLLVVVPIVGIYLLIDWERMIATVDGWLPEAHREDVRAIGHEIRTTVTGFIRGQIVICLVLAVFYAAALRAVGLNHAILIGLTAGLISFVPYLGAGTGLVVALCVAAAQFWPDWTLLVLVGSIFFVGETLADYVLSPRIIGSRVKLNPVWVMFALFACGYLFGFVGLLIAIPLAASIGVVLRFAMRAFLDEVATAPAAPALGERALRTNTGPSVEGRPALEHGSRHAAIQPEEKQ